MNGCAFLQGLGLIVQSLLQRATDDRWKLALVLSIKDRDYQKEQSQKAQRKTKNVLTYLNKAHSFFSVEIYSMKNVGISFTQRHEFTGMNSRKVDLTSGVMLLRDF